MILINQIKQKLSTKTPGAGSFKANSEMTLPILAELIRRDDGTYLLRPRVVDSELDSWIPPKKAAEIIGIHGRSIYRLIDPEIPFLVHKRPLKGVCLISFRSVQAYIQATGDPEFWTNRILQKSLTESVKKQMESLRGVK